MHIGVIGSGRIGVMHAGNAADHPNVSKVTIAARNPQRLTEASQWVRSHTSNPNVTVESSTDVTALLDSVDGVVIASSTPSHPRLTQQAVAAGVPVLVEKPLALELAELKDLATELESQTVPVMVAYQRRYDPAYQHLRSLIHSGELGTIRLARATGHDRLQIPLDYIPDSGGIWRDLMVHDFDIVPWVLGEEVVEVYASGGVLEENAYAVHGDLDTAVAMLTFASGAIATISGVRHNEAGHDVRLEVFGTKNTFGVGYDDRVPVTPADPGMEPPGQFHEDFIARFEPAFRAELDHFTKLIRSEVENLTPPSAGIDSLRIAIAAGESYRTKRPVALTQVV